MPAPLPPLPAADLAFVTEATAALWSEAIGKRFFITGGTGFFGMWLLESFIKINDSLDLGMHATVLTRNPAAFAHKAPHLTSRRDLNFIAGDIRTFAFPAGRFDYIVHAATEASATLNQEAPHEMLDAIIGGTRHVLNFAAQCGVQKLLLTSSGAVYGKQPCDLTHIPESYNGAPDPLMPSSAYGEGKRVSEHLCCVHALQHGYEVKIARCFAFVGPHLPLDGTYAIGNFIRDALQNKPINITGDGSPMRSYMYASDLVIWLWTLLFNAPTGRAYNVGSAEDLNIRQLAETVVSLIGACGPVHVAQSMDPKRPLARYVPLVNRAGDELGLNGFVSLSEGILKTAQWLGWSRSRADT